MNILTNSKKEPNNHVISNKYTIFLIVSFLMVIPLLLNRGLIDDGAFHFGRLCALSKDISFSNLKPWIYSHTFFGLGYPLGIFYPDLFLYPFALLVKIGMPAYFVFIFIIFCINFSSATAFYICIKKILQQNTCENYDHLAFVMSILYLAFPYRLWDVYERMAIGESMFFIFFPMIIYGIYALFYANKKTYALFLGMIGLVFSHILSAAMVVVFLIFFYILNIKKIIKTPKIIAYTLLNAFFTILCSLCVVLPILEMQNFTTLYYSTGVKTFGTLNTHTLQIIHSDVMSVIITLIVIVALIYLNRKAVFKTKLLLAGLFVMYMCTSLFPWNVLENTLPFINTLQFPWRLLCFSAVPFCILFGLLLEKHKPLYTFIPAILILCFLFLEIIKLINIDSLDIFGQYSIGQGEYLTNQLREYYIENNDIPPVNETYKIYHTGNTYKFTPIDNAVVLPLTYYKGYEIKDVKREYSYTEETGLIKVNDVKSNELYVTYKGTTVQKVSLIISIVSFICICIFIKKQRKNPLP